MKNWTCCVLSFVLLFTSSFSGNDVVKNVTAYFFEMFFGIREAREREIVIDLSVQELPEDMQIEIENIKAEILTEGKTEKTEKPDVLIYHTHTDEAYLKGAQDYVETSTGRTKNDKYSVVAVGDRLKNCLEGFGFNVIHDKTDNVSKGFNRAYQTSYETIEKYIGKTEVFIDLHRDAYYGQNPNTVIHNNREYARICFVVAKGENYTYKPNWQENYKLAQKLTDKLNEICPGISRDIIFKDTRFNQHVSNACLLIEMGNEQNTLEQVKASAEIVAEAFNRIF